MGCASSAPSSANRKKRQLKKDILRNGGGYSDQAVANIFDEAGNAVREAEEGVISFNEPVNFKNLSDAEDYMKSRILDPSRKTTYKFLDKSTTWSPDAGDYLEKKIERDKHRFELKVVKEEAAPPPPPAEKVAPKKTKKQRIKSIKKAVKTKKVGLIAEGDAASQDPTAVASEVAKSTASSDALVDAVEELMKKMEEDSSKVKQAEEAAKEDAGVAKDAVKAGVAEKEPPKPEMVANLDNVLETLLKLEEEKERAEEEAQATAAVEESSEAKPKEEKVEGTEGKAEEIVIEEVDDAGDQDDDAMTEVTASSVSLEDVTTIAEDNSEMGAADEESDSPEVVASSSTAEGKGQEVPTGDAPVGNGSAKNETHEGA